MAARSERAPLVMILSAMLIVPVLYGAGVVSRFGWMVREAPNVDLDHALILLMQPDSAPRLYVQLRHLSSMDYLDASVHPIESQYCTSHSSCSAFNVTGQLYAGSQIGDVNGAVVLTFYVPRDTQGFFWLTLPNTCPFAQAIAVGLQRSQVNASDFPGFNHFGIRTLCPAMSIPDPVSILAYSGMDIAIVGL